MWKNFYFYTYAKGHGLLSHKKVLSGGWYMLYKINFLMWFVETLTGKLSLSKNAYISTHCPYREETHNSIDKDYSSF